MPKELLSDTDYARGADNRFGTTALIGKVSKIECTDKQANVRVSILDKVDRNDQPLVTKPIPVWQVSAGGKKSFAMPRIGQNAVLVKLPNSPSDYLLLGTFYTTKDPPPIKDPKVDYCEWEGGHIEKHDANDNADPFLTQDFKAGWKGTYKKDVNLATTDSAKFNVKADGDMLLESANGNIDVKSPNGTVTIEQKTIKLNGNEVDITAATIKLTGHVIIVGAMDQSGGVHTDPNGHHTTSRAERDELLARIEALERRVTQLEARHGS